IPHRKVDRMTRSDGREIYRVVWPRGAGTVRAGDVEPRLSTLEGKTIGQLWDDLFRGDEIFPILEEELGRRFPGVRFVRYDTFGSTHGRDEQRVLAELPARLKDPEAEGVAARAAARSKGAGGGGVLRGEARLRDRHARRVAGQCGGGAGGGA